MIRITCIAALLIVWVTGAAAAGNGQLTPTNVTFADGLLYFDLVLTSMGDLNPASAMLGFASGLTLSGPGAAHLTLDHMLNIRTVAQWTAEIEADGGTYAFASFSSQNMSNCWRYGTRLSQVILDDYSIGELVATGETLARYYFGWDATPGLQVDFFGGSGDINILIHGYSDVLDPDLPPGEKPVLLNDMGEHGLDVVPEPATMGLLGLGLTVLAARRRGGR